MLQSRARQRIERVHLEAARFVAELRDGCGGGGELHEAMLTLIGERPSAGERASSSHDVVAPPLVSERQRRTLAAWLLQHRGLLGLCVEQLQLRDDGRGAGLALAATAPQVVKTWEAAIELHRRWSAEVRRQQAIAHGKQLTA